MIDPGPTRIHVPFESDSTVPWRTMISSSLGCLCGGWDIIPGLSVEIWISRFSSVAVGVLHTVRTDPTAFGLSMSEFQSKTCEPITVADSASANASPATAVAARATKSSLRFISLLLEWACSFRPAHKLRQPSSLLNSVDTLPAQRSAVHPQHVILRGFARLI